MMSMPDTRVRMRVGCSEDALSLAYSSRFSSDVFSFICVSGLLLADMARCGEREEEGKGKGEGCGVSRVEKKMFL